MVQGQKGMMQQHAWTRKAHHLADCLTLLGLVAMNGALGAGWLV